MGSLLCTGRCVSVCLRGRGWVREERERKEKGRGEEAMREEGRGGGEGEEVRERDGKGRGEVECDSDCNKL